MAALTAPAAAVMTVLPADPAVAPVPGVKPVGPYSMIYVPVPPDQLAVAPDVVIDVAADDVMPAQATKVVNGCTAELALYEVGPLHSWRT